jgi:hypothetical protein
MEKYHRLYLHGTIQPKLQHVCLFMTNPNISVILSANYENRFVKRQKQVNDTTDSIFRNHFFI